MHIIVQPISRTFWYCKIETLYPLDINSPSFFPLPLLYTNNSQQWLYIEITWGLHRAICWSYTPPQRFWSCCSRFCRGPWQRFNSSRWFWCIFRVESYHFTRSNKLTSPFQGHIFTDFSLSVHLCLNSVTSHCFSSFHIHINHLEILFNSAFLIQQV